MLAVVKTGGKQYLVSPKKRLKVEKLGKTVGEEFTFGEVLLVGDENGENVKIGAPFLSASRVSAKILSHGRGKKIKMLKYKPKKRYRKRLGHRQPYTEIEVQSVAP